MVGECTYQVTEGAYNMVDWSESKVTIAVGP